MAHARQQIRDAVVSAITSASTDAGDQVYSGHVYPLAQLPAIAVTTPSEEHESDQSGNDAFAYALVIAVACCAAKVSSLDDQLDDLAVQVHAALTGDSTLTGLISGLTLLETDTELEDEGKYPHGRLTMRWGALYHVDPSDPETLVS